MVNVRSRPVKPWRVGSERKLLREVLEYSVGGLPLLSTIVESQLTQCKSKYSFMPELIGKGFNLLLIDELLDTGLDKAPKGIPKSPRRQHLLFTNSEGTTALGDLMPLETCVYGSLLFHISQAKGLPPWFCQSWLMESRTPIVAATIKTTENTNNAYDGTSSIFHEGVHMGNCNCFLQ